MRSSSPRARPRCGLEEDGLLSGGLVAQACGHLPCYTGHLVASQERFHGGRAPVWPPQPTWAQVRKAGMSRTGTLRVSAFTRRFRSSVSSTTSRSSRIGSSVGTREQKNLSEGRRQRHWLPLPSLWREIWPWGGEVKARHSLALP